MISPGKSDDLWSYHGNLVKDRAVRSAQLQENEMPIDLKHYMTQPVIQHTQNLIDYWQNFSSVYPILG